MQRPEQPRFAITAFYQAVPGSSLQQSVAEGRFREVLFYRLNMIEIRIRRSGRGWRRFRVRELESAVERALVTSKGRLLTEDDVGFLAGNLESRRASRAGEHDYTGVGTARDRVIDSTDRSK